MNATIRNLMIAAPLATAALALGAAPALAAPVGPVDYGISQPDNPHGLDDKAPPPDDDGPVVNPDLPQGPDDITDHPPCPTHGVDCGGGGDPVDPGDPGDDPGDEPGGNGDEPGEVNDVPVPTRIDTGAGGSTGDDGIEIAWVLAGGALITVTGAAFTGRSLARNRS